MNSKRYILVDLIKFYMSIVILIFHYNLFLLGGNHPYMFKGGYLAVDVFFIISGFFLGKTIFWREKEQINVLRILFGKIRNLYLHYFLALAIIATFMWTNAERYSLDIHNPIRDVISFVGEVLMVQEWGIPFLKPTYNGQAWYVSAMIASILIITLVFKVVSLRLRRKFLFGFTAVSYMFIAVIFKNLHVHGMLGPIPVGVLRGLAGIAVGILIFSAKNQEQNEGKERIHRNIMFTAIAVVACTALWMCNRDSYIDFFIVPIGILLVWFAMNVKSSNQKLNRASRVLSEISYVIYLNQGVTRFAMDKYIEKYSCVQYVAACVVVAITIYYLVAFISKKAFTKGNIVE